LQAEGHPIDVGTTGENLTIKGLDWEALEIGMEISVGEALIELTNLAPPCNTIIDSFSDKRSTRIFEEKYPGWSRWYAKVLTEGIVEAGDIVTIL
jgi:MOSC domain-containing protein YiiM